MRRFVYSGSFTDTNNASIRGRLIGTEQTPDEVPAEGGYTIRFVADTRDGPNLFIDSLVRLPGGNPAMRRRRSGTDSRRCEVPS